MAVRQIEPIDRAELRATIQKWIDAHTDVDDTDGVGLLEDVLWEINAQPTLTPPNETPPCYQPDGDGCAYQRYDGDDEPIDKCKECPLCYSDKQRHHAPPNEPLTLEQLREMDDPTPVWWKKAGYWCLCERGFIIVPNGNIYEFEETDGAFYRRPPEGET